jgi:hypothetical protein
MDDHSAHLELDLNFWLEAGSTDGLDINPVYGISNIIDKVMRAGRSVSTVGTS